MKPTHFLLFLAMNLVFNSCSSDIFDSTQGEGVKNPALGATHPVFDAADWIDAIEAAKPGDTIVIQSNLSSPLILNDRIAHWSTPITIKAAKPQVTKLHSLRLIGCVGIRVESFLFGSNEGTDTYLKIENSKYVKIFHNIFDHRDVRRVQNAIIVNETCESVEIAKNDFRNKNVAVVGGSYIKAQYKDPAIAKNLYIHHNHFKDIAPLPKGDSWDGDSDREAIVLGVSASQDLFTDYRIEYNLFENCDGENEIITVKTSRNHIRYNTFVNCLGGVCLRLGSESQVYGNFFLADAGNKNAYSGDTGGVRIYGSRHKVYNNYFGGLTGRGKLSPICFGDGDTLDSSGGDRHERPSFCEVVNNTVVHSAEGISMGKPGTDFPASGCKIANNIVVNTANVLFKIDAASGAKTTFEGNIGFGTTPTSGYNLTSNALRIVDPKLTKINAVYRIVSTSPAVNFAKGNYSYVLEDMDGQLRNINDCGADESSTSSVSRAPLTAAQVGPNAY